MEHWQEICCFQILDGLYNMSEDERCVSETVIWRRQQRSCRLRSVEALDSGCSRREEVQGMPPDTLDPWLYTMLVGQDSWAHEALDIKDLILASGQEVVFRELDNKVVADWMGEVTVEAIGLKLVKNETTEACTGDAACHPYAERHHPPRPWHVGV